MTAIAVLGSLAVLAAPFAIGCRQAGTIEIEQSAGLEACVADTGATYVTAEFVLGGECGDCACGDLRACPTCTTGECTYLCQAKAECGVDEELAFDPPAAGTYAMVLHYYDDLDAVRATVCFKITVDADGTQSRAQITDRFSCCP